jgi:epoxyqueuosine reductase
MMATKKTGQKKTARTPDLLSSLEVDAVGVARVAGLPDERMKEAILNLLPGARSMIVVAIEIWPEFLDLTSPEMTAGGINTNDIYQQHQGWVRGKLSKAVYDIAKASRAAGFKALPLTGEGPAVDRRTLHAIISYKHAAEYAGLGKIGMSSLLITEKFGPRVRVAICLTEAELEPTPVLENHVCRYCNVCVFKCPAKALSRPKPGEAYAINKFACREYVEASGGCSECMRVCPVASPKYSK